jgi:intein/homing endonuclease
VKLTKELAEILGMFAADGCLQNDYICMWGNITEDKNYYDKIVCPLFSKTFNRKVIAHAKKSNSVYGFYICDKKIVKIFEELGFSNNKTYNVKAPKIILKNNDDKIIASFVRGYADCDGCLYFQRRRGKYKEFKLKHNTYPKIEMDSVSQKMAQDISYLLDKLNIPHTINISHSKKDNEKPKHRVMIRGPPRVELFLSKISFNNPAQHSKYLIWKKFGMCPIRTTLEQRKLILKSKLDPFSLVKDGPGRI